MILTIRTTHQPASDLGYLLHKHPGKLQTVQLAAGHAHVFYTEATEDACTACLLLDINPIDLVRGERGKHSFLPQHYVNDRPYTSNSMMSTAIAKVFGSALNGTCQTHPDLVVTPISLTATLSALRVDSDKVQINRLFEPLGYDIEYESVLLDPDFPDWGESKAVNLTVTKTTTLRDLLSQLYVFILALDPDRHFWVSHSDIEVLLRRGAGWLDQHPQKEWITRRYLKNLRELTSQALLRLAGDEPLFEIPIAANSTVNLHQQRLNMAFEQLKASGAQSVLDIGCGEGKLIQLLIKEGQFKKIAGMDVSFTALQRAKAFLHIEEASPALRNRLNLFQGSVVYKDERLQHYDAIALVEVIEHLDEERLPAMEKIVFGFAAPKTVVISTPNAEYNAIYERLVEGDFRHSDHRFEWTRAEFDQWCHHIASQFGFSVTIFPVGEMHETVGAPSQLAVFKK